MKHKGITLYYLYCCYKFGLQSIVASFMNSATTGKFKSQSFMGSKVNISLVFCCGLDISPKMALYNFFFLFLLKVSIMYAIPCKEISKTHTRGYTSQTNHFLHLYYSHHNINKHHLPPTTWQQPSDWSLNLLKMEVK